MDDDKINKGRYVLGMRIKSHNDGKADERYGLHKIPVECLYAKALEQIGEQESYIEELEERIKTLEKEMGAVAERERVLLLREIKKEAIAEARKTQYYQKLEGKLSEQGRQIRHLRSLCVDLINEVARLNGWLLPQGEPGLSPGVEEAAGE